MDFSHELDRCLEKASFNAKEKYDRTIEGDSEERLMDKIYTDDIEVLEYELYSYPNDKTNQDVKNFEKYILKSLKNAKSLKHIVFIESDAKVDSSKYVDLIHDEYPNIDVHTAKREYN